MNKIIIFNWKMNPASAKEAKQLFSSMPKGANGLEIVVAAPFVYLESLIASTSAKEGYGGLRFASQNCFWENQPAGGGAYTGEISPIMLKNLGVEYVIIGHSERRNYIGETDEMINRKVLAALKVGLKVVLCVGEPERVSSGSAKDYIKNQLEKDLSGAGKLKIENSIVAYEPVWALSTTNNGRPDTPEDALEMIKYIRKFLISNFQFLNPMVIYGGSVDSKNIQSFLKYKEIDGALVGGASLKKEEVKKIILNSNYDK